MARRRLLAVQAVALLAAFALGGMSVRQQDLPPMPLPVPRLSFSNPFRQYDSGAIPGWEYGGDTMLSNDFVTLTSVTANNLGWIWSSEPTSMDSWEAELEFHVRGAVETLTVLASRTHPPIHPSIRPPAHPPTHPPVHSSTHPPIYPGE